MAKQVNCVAIIPAGGTGSRFGSQIPKQYSNLLNIPIIIRTLQLFDDIPEISKVIIALDPEWLSFVDNKTLKHKIKKTPSYVKSGVERQNSVYNCLFIDEVINSDIVLIHDAVRPFTSKDLIRNVIKETLVHKAVVPTLQPKETIKLINEDAFIEKTIPRTKLRNAQTPQGFRTNIIIPAYKKAIESQKNFTDDAAIVEYSGQKVKSIQGEDSNIKITTPFDLLIAETIINHQLT